MVPEPGCPGPRRLLDSGLVRVLAIDSAWWLRDANERTISANGRGCARTTSREVAAALTAELACANPGPCPPRIVLAHHPLLSYGSHAGYFGWQEHFVCASYLPLPGLCSLYIGLRKLGIGDQDMASPGYRAYIEEVGQALAVAPPLVFAAGHEHVLQVLRDDAGTFHVVSGSGSRLGRVGRGPRTLYARAAPGVATLDFEIDGTARLSAYVLGADGLHVDYEEPLLPADPVRASVGDTHSAEVER